MIEKILISLYWFHRQRGNWHWQAGRMRAAQRAYREANRNMNQLREVRVREEITLVRNMAIHNGVAKQRIYR